MVLFGDIAGDDADAVARRHCGSGAHCQRAAVAKASSPSAPRRARNSGWTASAPRPSRKHTNAFKINEDVVIPLPRMAEYTDGIERINIELSLQNKLRAVRRADRVSRRGDLPLGKADDANDDAARPSCWKTVRRRRWHCWSRKCVRQWQGWLDAVCDDRCSPAAGPQPARQLEDRRLRAPLQADLHGCGVLTPVLDGCNAIHKRVLEGRVWVALHMHAGDGNVHTNIPVNSDDYDMLQTAHGAVKRIMALARSLDGVISGEHGIGITKLEFLTRSRAGAFHRLQSARWIPKAASTKASCYESDAAHGKACAALTDAHISRFDQCLHALLRPDGARVA